MLIKRINRYAVIRMPNELNYILSVEKRNRLLNKRNNIGKTVKNFQNIYSKLPITVEIHNGSLEYYCCNCGIRLMLSNEFICSRRYFRCSCGCINDLKSKSIMKYYLIYEPYLYNQIICRRKNNRNDVNRRNRLNVQWSIDKYNKSKEPIITIVRLNDIFPNASNNRAIVPVVWKEIMEDESLTDKEKSVLCEMQMPVLLYKNLKLLGLKFDNECNPVTDEERKQLKNLKIESIPKSESVKHYNQKY